MPFTTFLLATHIRILFLVVQIFRGWSDISLGHVVKIAWLFLIYSYLFIQDYRTEGRERIYALLQLHEAGTRRGALNPPVPLEQQVKAIVLVFVGFSILLFLEN